ncbi:MAG: hypothetical protein ACLQVD_17325 [Capsulimonadaceae bacterium]
MNRTIAGIAMAAVLAFALIDRCEAQGPVVTQAPPPAPAMAPATPAPAAPALPPRGPMTPPFAFGTVKSVDVVGNTIVLTTPRGDTTTINVTPTTRIQGRTAIKVGDLKTGETIMVNGVPTGITANTITLNDAYSTPAAPRPAVAGSSTGATPTPAPVANTAPPIANASGTVTSLKPLTISLNDSSSLVIKLSDTVQVQHIGLETIKDIAVNDWLTVNGRPTGNGSLDAGNINVNMSPRMGPRMPGPMGLTPGAPGAPGSGGPMVGAGPFGGPGGPGRPGGPAGPGATGGPSNQNGPSPFGPGHPGGPAGPNATGGPTSTTPGIAPPGGLMGGPVPVGPGQ